MDLSDAELEEFMRAFKILDREGEGCIQAKDLGHFMNKIGKTPTESQLQSLINQIDSDGNGTIEFDEFVQAVMHWLTTDPSEDDLRETFRIYDKDSSGFIGPDQIKAVMLALDLKPTAEELDDMIREADEDEDGVLSYEDFCQMMTPSK